MFSADRRSKFSTFFTNFWNSNIYCHIWIQHEKCIQMSTNKPSIGAVVLEIVSVILRKYCQLPTFTNWFCHQCVNCEVLTLWQALSSSTFFAQNVITGDIVGLDSVLWQMMPKTIRVWMLYFKYKVFCAKCHHPWQWSITFILVANDA